MDDNKNLPASQDDAVVITPEILDALNNGLGDRGRGGDRLGSHGLRAIQHLRAIFQAAGFKVELHDLERVEAARLRTTAFKLLDDAHAIDGGHMR